MKWNFDKIDVVKDSGNADKASTQQEVEHPSTDMGRFVEGTGDKTTIFGVPYGTFKRLKPEHKQYYYDKAIKAEKLAQAKDIETRATKVSEDAYGRLENKEEASRKENPILSALSAGAGEMAGFTTPYQAVADPDIAASSATINKINDARNIISESNSKDGTMKEFGKGILNRVKDHSFWDFGAKEVSDSKALLFAAQKKQRGEQTTQAENNLLESAALNAAVHGDFNKDVSEAYKQGENIGNTASYMKDFLLTGGLQGLGRAAVEKFGVDAAKKTIAQIAKNTALRAGGDLLGAAGMAATVHAGQTAADAMDRMTGDVIPSFDKDGNAQFDKTEGGESGGKALAKAFGNTIIQDYSEMFGEYFSPINSFIGKTAGKVADKIGLKKVHEAIASIPSSEWGKAYNHFTDQTHWNGFTGEYGEELVGTAMNAAFVGDQKFSDLIDPKQQSETFLSVALMSAVMGSANVVGYRTPKYLAKQNLKTADQNAFSKFGEEWNQLRLQIDNAGDEGKVSIMNNVLSDKDLSPEKKNAFTEYVARLQAYHGTNIADAKRKIEGEVPEEQLQLENSYDQGTSIVEPAERKAAKDELDSISSNLSDEEISLLNKYQSIQDYHVDSLTSEDETPFVTYDTASKYLNAKAKYDGLIDGVRGDIENKVQEADKAITDRTHKDGNIYEVRLKTDDNTPYYIVKGNISFDSETKSVNTKNLDGHVVIVDSEGKLDMRPIRDIEKLYNQDSAEQLKDTTAQTIRNQESEKAANEIEGVRDFAQDELVTINTPEGLKEVVVNGITPEGNYEVVSTDNSPIINGEVATVLDKKQLSQMENEAKKVQTIDQPGEAGEMVQDNEAVTPSGEDTNLEGITTEQISNSPVATGSNMSEVQSENESTPPVEQNNLSNEEQSVPLDEDGEPIFHQMPVEQSASLLSELDPEDSFLIIDNNINALSKEVDKLSKTKPKSTSFNKIKAEREEIKGRLAEAQQKLDYWNTLKDAMNKPAEVEQTPEEQAQAEQEAIAGVQAINQPAAKPIEVGKEVHTVEDDATTEINTPAEGNKPEIEAQPINAKKLSTRKKGTRYGARNEELGDYLNLRDYLLRSIATGTIKFNWKGTDRTKGIGAHLGLSDSRKEMNKRLWMRTSDESATPEQIAEGIMADAPSHVTANLADQDVFNEILDILQSHDIPSSMMMEAESMHQNNEDKNLELEKDVFDASEERAKRVEQEREDEIKLATEQNAIEYKQAREEIVTILEKFGITEEEKANFSSIFDLINYVNELDQQEIINQNEQKTNETGDRELGNQTSSKREIDEEVPETTGGSQDGGRTEGNQSENDLSGKESLNPEHQKITEEISSQIDNEISELDKLISEKQKEYETKKNKFGKALSEESQGEIFPTEKANDGDLFNVARDVSQNNARTILEPIKNELDALKSEKKALQEGKQKRIDNAIEADKAQKKIDFEAEKVNTTPTEAQKEAGNYKMGHIKVQGFDITLENPQGSQRSGTDADGNEWSITMNNHYGYFKGTEGKDGDHIDTFLGDNLDSDKVFVVDQINQDGSFDEHKVMLGFNSVEEAKAAYLSNYEEGWQGLGGITETTVENFRKWTNTGTRKIKPFADYKKMKDSSTPELSQEQKDAISFVSGKKEEPINENSKEVNKEVSNTEGANSNHKSEEKTDNTIEKETDAAKIQELKNAIDEEILFRDSQSDKPIVEFSEKHGVNPEIIERYIDAISESHLGRALNALHEVRSKVMNDNKGLKLLERRDIWNKVKQEIYDTFGSLDNLQKAEEQKAIERDNLMKSARKREEEKAKDEKKRLREFEAMNPEELDTEYFKALEENNEARARDIINEAQKRNEYSTDTNYKVSHSAPKYDPTGYDKSLVEIANGEMESSLNAIADKKTTDESRKKINDAISQIKKEAKATVTIYRAVPKDVNEKDIRNGDWVTLSKKYAKDHGESTLKGEYKILEKEVPADELFWDGNDINEWGYDDKKDYAYKNTGNNKKLNDLVTRDYEGSIIPPSKRFDSSKEDIRFREDADNFIDIENEKFNNELQQQIDGTLPKSHIYQLGKPGNILKSAGIPDLQIELASKRLEIKSNQDNHVFDLKDIINLPNAIQNPIAVFNSKTQPGSKVILTELSNGEKNYIVAIKAVNKLVSGERRLEVNEIKSLYPKDTKQIVKWISQDNLLNWVDKEKADKFLNIPQSNSEDDTQGLNSLSSATKIIQNFENPTLEDGEIVSSVENLTEQLNAKVKIITNLDEITDENKTTEKRKRNSKGWFDPKTGDVVIVLPNAESVEDAKRTILHEVVAHKGLRSMFGKEFDSFLGQVYDNATPEIRKKINSMAVKYGWNINIATEEYLASLSEKGFEDKQEQTLWGKIKQAFMDMVHKAKINLGYNISDEDLRYILWKSYQKLNNDSPILKNAADAAMKDKLFRSSKAPKQDISNVKSEANSDVLFRKKEEPVTPENLIQTYDRLVAEKTNKEISSDKTGKGIKDRFIENINNNKIALSNLSHRIVEGYRDNMRSVKILQDLVSKATGKEIKDHENVYLNENALSSINNAESNWCMNNIVDPLEDFYGTIQREYKISKDNLEIYMNSKSGLERNEVFAKRDADKWAEDAIETANKMALNGEINSDQLNEMMDAISTKIEQKYEEFRQNDYSGLTAIFGEDTFKEEAQKCIDDIEQIIGVDNAEKLWDLIKRMNQWTLHKEFISGRISRKDYEKVKDMMKYYLPMRGFEESVASDYYNYIQGDVSPVNGALKNALGRKSRPDEFIPTMKNMLSSAIALGNRNTFVYQKFLNLALNHKTNLLSVSEQWYSKQKGADGEDVLIPMYPEFKDGNTAEENMVTLENFEENMKRMEAEGNATKEKGKLNIDYKSEKWQANEHAVRVKRLGKEYVVYVNGNPKAAQAINGILNDNDLDIVSQKIANLNRFYARNVTSRNAEFLMTNIQRDISYSLPTAYIKEGAKYSTLFSKNLKNNMSPIVVKGARKGDIGGIYNLYNKYKNNTLDESKEDERCFKEFIDFGGETGVSILYSVDDYKKMMAKTLNKKGTIIGESERALKMAAESIEFVNRGVENYCRFAAYQTSRQMGKSVLKSIADAKDISVNFNRKGSGAMGAKYAKAYYMFLNPAIQSLFQMSEMIKNHPKRAIPVYGTITALGFIMGMVGRMIPELIGGGDDDKYINLTPWQRRNNLCIWVGDGYLRYTLSQELRTFYGIGEIACSAMNGEMNHDNIGMEIASQLSQAFPLDFIEGNGELSAKALVPTIMKPSFESYVWNEDFIGRPISYDKDWNALDPEFKRAGKNTSDISIAISEYLNNKVGNGNDFKKSTRPLTDINPSKVEHIFMSVMGGMAAFPSKIIKTGQGLFSEEDVDLYNVPFLNKFYTKTSDKEGTNRRVNSAYKYYQTEFNQTNHQIKGFGDKDNRDIIEYANTLDKIYTSGEYNRWEVMKQSEKEIKKLRESLSDKTSPEDIENITEMIQNVKVSTVKQLEETE